MSPRILAICLLAGLVSACQTLQPPPPPVLTVSAAECATEPALAQAVPLVFNPEQVTSETRDIGADAACLQDEDGRKSQYALFRLPANASSSTVSVASVAFGRAVFALRVLALDADGRWVRELDRDSFMFRGGSLTSLFRPRPDEQFLLIASDPDAVGKEFSRTSLSMSTQMVTTGTVFMNLSHGADTTTNFVYAHSGRIVVSIQPPPT